MHVIFVTRNLHECINKRVMKRLIQKTICFLVRSVTKLMSHNFYWSDCKETKDGKLSLSCKKCPKFYTSEFSLNHHQKIHEEKKHTCTIWQKSSTIDKAYSVMKHFTQEKNHMHVIFVTRNLHECINKRIMKRLIQKTICFLVRSVTKLMSHNFMQEMS